MENIPNNIIIKNQRPLLLSAVCIFSFIYYGFLLAVFITSLFFPQFISNVLNNYLTEHPVAITLTYAILLSGILLFGALFAGIYFFWRLNKKAIYFYFPAKTVYLILLFLTHNYSWYNISLSILLIIIYLFFARKLQLPDNKEKP